MCAMCCLWEQRESAEKQDLSHKDCEGACSHPLAGRYTHTKSSLRALTWTLHEGKPPAARDGHAEKSEQDASDWLKKNALAERVLF